jgi:zinc transporter 1/2/3
MTSLVLFKSLAALIILLTSLLAGLAPLRKARANPEHRWLELGEALGGGVFLGIGLFHMLPDAEEAFRNAYGSSASSYPYAELLCAFGFVLLLFLEKFVLQFTRDKHADHHNHNHQPSATVIPYLLPLVLSVHAFIEGTALGINTTLVNVLAIFIAIIAHKGSESFALATNLGRSHLAMRRAMPLFLIWAMMSPLGVLVGSAMASNLQSHTGQVTAAVFNAFAAGTFLYIATLHKTTHMCSSKNSNHFLEFGLMLVGLGIMALVEIWL